MGACSRLGLLTLLQGPTFASGFYLRGASLSSEVASSLDVFSLTLQADAAQQPAWARERRVQSPPNDAVKDGYVEECQASLLSDDSLEDGLISQAEFADMLFNLCLRNIACPHRGAVLRGELSFEQLELSLQLDFVNGVCPQKGPKRRECILGLNEMWLEGNEFGLLVDEVDGVGLERLVHDMCIATSEDVVSLGFASGPEPTPAPSRGPTNSPSSPPSLAPTMPPSYIPTSTRTRAPSQHPTRLPTASPSFSPTSDPNYPTTSGPSVAIAQLPIHPSQERFVDECASYLLAPSFVGDGIVSQDEFVRFLIHHCIQKGMCDDRTILTFEELPVGLQLEFIYGACSTGTPGDREDRLDGCVGHLEKMSHVGVEFGFDADDAVLEERLQHLCLQSYAYALEIGLTETPKPRTPSPSSVPTPAPSISEQPSAAKEAIVELEPPSSSPEDDGSLSRRAVIGMSFAFALTAAAACIVYMRHHPRSLDDEKKLDKDPHHFGIAAQEPWGKPFPLPLSYANLGPNSVGSASSSFRDYRFVSVYGPGGNAIPQFNPNTAGAVVIGSVTIGGSSSISSGPFGCAGSRASTRSRSFFTLGKMSWSKGSPGRSASSKDDMSSISSSRSSLPRHRASKTPVWLDRRSRVNLTSPAASHNSSSSGSRTKLSRNTVPMSHQRQKGFKGRDDLHGQVTIGDWKAVSYMTDFRHPSEATDASAVASQGQFFFDALLCTDAAPFPPSDWTPASVTCQSLPNMPQTSCLGSDAGASSILSESYFQEGSSFIQPQSVTTSTHSASTSRDRSSSNDIFVPWRREGFNSSLRLSDSKHSDSSSSCAESIHVPAPQRKLALIRPAKSLLAKKKTRAKHWFSSTFRNSHYQHLNKGIALQEDPSVISMKSNYSGHQLLLPHAMAPTMPNVPPNLVLGTFAAATLPLNAPRAVPLKTSKEPASITEQPLPESLSPETIVEKEENTSTDIVGTDGDDEAAEAANVTEESVAQRDLEPEAHFESVASPRVCVHISALDANVFTGNNDSGSFSPYSRSDFDSSDPTKSGEFCVPNCELSEADTSQSNSYRDVDCSFAAASAPYCKEQRKVGGSIEDVSLLSGSDAFDANSASKDEPTDGVHLIGISQLLSETESSEGSNPSSASTAHEEKDSPVGKQYPSDEETVPREDDKCANGTDVPNESAIVSDDSVDMRGMRQVLALFDDPEHQASTVCEEGTAKDMSRSSDMPIGDSLIITGQDAADVTALSSSLSWESEGHSSFVTAELDARMSTAVPMDTTQLSI
ncbi:LOW QUALITY PROTEIN: hypothetical protein ACHAXT_002181 [Thalassiosira profunda]